MGIERESVLYCLCGPSGVGKSTITRALLERVDSLELSVSATTRSPRGEEREGQHYYFKSQADFEADVARGEFLEWASYNDNSYGTPLRNLRECELRGSDLLLDIDVQGAKTLREKLPKQVIVIFVAAPSFQDLSNRLSQRGTESAESQQKRLKRAEEEQRLLSQPEVSDYLVVNDSLERAISQCAGIIAVERLRLSRFTPAFRRNISGS